MLSVQVEHSRNTPPGLDDMVIAHIMLEQMLAECTLNTATQRIPTL
jgi:hypothetical protein